MLARDLFLIGCYTGVRFSDIDQVKSKIEANLNIKNITIKQQKTGGRVTIPVLPIVRDLVRRNPHNITNQRLNKYIKEVGQFAKIDELTTVSETKGKRTEIIKSPKYNLITTHTARRSFATNFYLMGLPVKTIMNITGHKKEESFYKYIRLSNREEGELFQEAYKNNNLNNTTKT